jgi:hypothetical protein
MFGKQLPAYGMFARHVNGLKAADVKLGLASADLRPAIVCDDGVGLEFANWKLPANADADCLVRLESVRQARFEGFAPEGKMRAFLRVEGRDSAQIQLNNNSLGSAENAVEFGKDAERGMVTGP